MNLTYYFNIMYSLLMAIMNLTYCFNIMHSLECCLSFSCSCFCGFIATTLGLIINYVYHEYFNIMHSLLMVIMNLTYCFNIMHSLQCCLSFRWSCFCGFIATTLGLIINYGYHEFNAFITYGYHELNILFQYYAFITVLSQKEDGCVAGFLEERLNVGLNFIISAEGGCISTSLSSRSSFIEYMFPMTLILAWGRLSCLLLLLGIQSLTVWLY